MDRAEGCGVQALEKAFLVLFGGVVGLIAPQRAEAWPNMLKDPGFEEYRLDPRGFYTLHPDSSWAEITMGRGSVQLDMNDWEAPEEMIRERPLNFTPGTTGYEGESPDQNTGRMILQQDVISTAFSAKPGCFYEAWIWLGGAGRDDDSGSDQEEEVGGWELFFYDNDDSSTWKGSKPLEYHHVTKDFWGKESSFVRVAGYGRIPEGTKGVRMRVWAATWGQASQPGQRSKFDTEVAVDNAHFAIIDAPNLLINGDFELDDREIEFKGWQRPAAWPFPRNGMQPLDINEVFGDAFDQGGYRPFCGGRRSYGYGTHANGWPMDAFTFGQYVDYPYPDGTPLMLMFNWIQAAEKGAEWELRLIGSKIEIVAEYIGERGHITAESFWLDWPVPAGKACVGRYDQNSGQPFCPRLALTPPAGTRRVGVHINFMVHAPYRDGFRSIKAAVDDFFLVSVDKP